jgi:5-methylcytosine-specific restriction endonuclease McrA
VCEYCGETFKKPVSTYNKDIRDGKPQGCCQLHTWVLKGGTLSLTCSECGKVFERSKSRYEKDNKDGGYVFCSRECQDKNLDYILRGEDHYRYIDGKSSGYRGKGWGRIRRRIRERDKHTCYLCGKTRQEIGKELDVHHLIRFEDFEDENDANQGINLISLCPSCHHSEEVNPTIPRIVPLIRERKERRAA